MRIGKISQTEYRRSILKQLHTEGNAALFAPTQEESCFGIQKDTGQILSSSVSLYGNEKDLCVFAMAQAMNHLASRGAAPKGVSIQIMLTEFAYESRLKAMIQAASQAAAEQRVEILAADAQVVPQIQTTIVHITAIGVVQEELSTVEGIIRSRTARPGQEIVLLKWIGLEGTLRIKREKQVELEERFIPAFINRIETYQSQIFSVNEMKRAAFMGVTAMHQIVDGGILSALWNLAEGAGIGLSIDMKKIAVKQETIEVCEYFHLNPYQLTSAGSVLMITPKGEELVDVLRKEGTSAVIIGHTTEGRERVIMNGEEKRYIDKPAPDELTKVFTGV